MEENIKELQLQTVLKCSKDDTGYLAILKEREGSRILPVLMERDMAMQLMVQLRSVLPSVLPSCTAEVMKAVFQQTGMELEEVRVAAVQAGMTYCHLLYRAQGMYHMVRYCKASDSLVLASTFGCRITINENLLAQQYMREVGNGTYSLPLNSVALATLREALQRAIEDENYELASLLRDEIEKRT